MLIAILTLIAGFLSVLAPCILPLLPIIIGGGFAGVQDKRRPYIITASLVISLMVFTILLKVSTSLIGIDPSVWSYVSGAIIVGLGLTMLFPHYWDLFIGRIGIQAKSQELLGKAGRQKNSTLQAILIGAALGPVFSSCSPMYAWVIATVLPESTIRGVVLLGFYCIGLSISLLLISLMGRRVLEKIKWASNPTGWFQRVIAIVFILVGLAVATGFQKTVQTYLVDKDFLNIKTLEEKLVPEDKKEKSSLDITNSQNDLDPKRFNVDPYAAPEITGITEWINSDPLTIESLRGKVVLVDFWTYSCINCIRTLPYVEKWYETYKDDGLVVIGMHAPEFAFEKVPENVRKAVEDRGLTYPVALDNIFATWQAYNNRFWPASYLIDRNGNVRREHFGEGEYMESEQAIRDLLGESAKDTKTTVTSVVNVPTSRYQTPETYLGGARAERKVISTKLLAKDEWSTSGSWDQTQEELISTGNDSILKIKVTAKKVFLVMSPTIGGTSTIGVSLNGISQSPVLVVQPDLYKIIDSTELLDGATVELLVPIGTKLNAFTFES